MKIGVSIAQVPATDARVYPATDKKYIEIKDLKYVISPYDEFALEEALKIKDLTGAEVFIISVGPERVQTALREGLALGADRAIHILEEERYFDSFYISKLLSEYLKKENADILFFGKMGVGFDHSQTPSMVAALLDLPYVNNVTEIKIEGNLLKVKREIEGASLRYELGLPCILSAEKGLNTPRLANLKGIMAAKKKPLQTIKASDLIQRKESIELLSLELPPQKSKGKVISGEDPRMAAEELLKFLKDEVKII